MAANIFTGATNANWGTNTNWSLAAVPTANDGNVATFNVASPSCTVNAQTRVCNGIDFTGYTNQITMTFGINVSGNITIPAPGGGMAISGSGVLGASAAGNLTSNGFTIPNFAINVASGNRVLQDNWNVTNFSTANVTTTCNGFQINVSTSMSLATGLNGTTTIRLTGGTWTGTGQLVNNLNLDGNISVTNGSYATGTMTYTSGTFTASGSMTLNNCTLTNTGLINFNNITIPNTGITITINGTNSALNVIGNITTVASNALTFNGGNVNIGGNLNLNTMTTSSIAGTSLLRFTTNTINGANFPGGGTISVTGLTSGLFNSSIEIDCGSTSTTLTGNASSNFPFRGTLTYTSGTIADSNIHWVLSGATATKVTCNSPGLSFLGDITSSVNTTFTGTDGFTMSSFSMTTAGTTLTLVSAKTYIITTLFKQAGSFLSHNSVVASSSTDAILTINNGASIEVAYVDATHIDSSGGKTVWDFGSANTLTNTTNWRSFTYPATVMSSFVT